jgi:hypothetical protein
MTKPVHICMYKVMQGMTNIHMLTRDRLSPDLYPVDYYLVQLGLGGLPVFRFYFQTVFFGLAFTKTGKPSLRNCLLSSPETRLNSQNMTLIKRNYMTLDTNSIIFP